MLVGRHVNQLYGGRLRGFMVKSSCGFDKRALLILQLSKQHRRRRHAGFLGWCLVALVQGRPGRIVRDSVRMTDGDLTQQVPKR